MRLTLPAGGIQIEVKDELVIHSREQRPGAQSVTHSRDVARWTKVTKYTFRRLSLLATLRPVAAVRVPENHDPIESRALMTSVREQR